MSTLTAEKVFKELILRNPVDFELRETTIKEMAEVIHSDRCNAEFQVTETVSSLQTMEMQAISYLQGSSY